MDASSTATHVLNRRDYLAARKEWLDEGNVISSAGQGLPLARAVTDLEHGEVTDPGNKAQYEAVINALRDFMAMPDAMDTPAEDAQARADAVKIDKFFRLRGYGACDSWPSTRKACWEPASNGS